MNQQIEEIIENLNEGDEVTLVLKNGEQVTGTFRHFDDEHVILRAKSGNTPDLGWNIDAIEDIVTHNMEPAGDVVTVDFTDIKTGRKVVVSLDVSGDEVKVKMEAVPAVNEDEGGWYVFFATKFMKALYNPQDEDQPEE